MRLSYRGLFETSDALLRVGTLALGFLMSIAPAVWSQEASEDGRLFDDPTSATSSMIAGVPLDSEYLVFIIDTSGSMRTYAWDDVQRHIIETIDAYPSVEGIHVISDEGEYLLERFSGDWIPNVPARRNEMLQALASWKAFSNSSPYEGILTAIDAFYDPGKNIGVYVYSDDFAQGSLDSVLASVYRSNHLSDTGTRKVRIHAVAFPVYYEVTGSLLSAGNYATLMRELCQRNGGSFIALSPR